jgi:cardiolipin synthase A/B
MLVDGVFASIGTANMDIRSFDQNFEVNALIYDEEITQKLEEQYLADLNNCIFYTLEEWESRSWINSTKESLARILSPLF